MLTLLHAAAPTVVLGHVHAKEWQQNMEEIRDDMNGNLCTNQKRELSSFSHSYIELNRTCIAIVHKLFLVLCAPTKSSVGPCLNQRRYPPIVIVIIHICNIKNKKLETVLKTKCSS